VYISSYRRRFHAVFLCFIVFLLVCAARLLYIQFFRASYLAELARKQHSVAIELEPRRGTIYDSNLKPQAVNVQVDSVFASPNEIKDVYKEAIARKVSSVLGIDAGAVRKKLEQKKSFVWIARKIPESQGQVLRGMGLKGIGFIKESKRCYPNGYLLSQLMGFSGIDGVGLEGLEMSLDKYLRGEKGWAFLLRDARQQKLDLADRMVAPRDGYDLVLTVDEVIQFIAERELDKVYQKYNARGASIVVMNPHTGAILAMASRPTYDPNDPGKAGKDARRNRSVCDMFEPGSVYKIVTASAALEEKRVNENTRVFCENGAYRVANHVLHDHEPHGWLTFKQVVEQSSNIGTVKIAQQLGPQIVYKYSRAFGFGVKTGIDVPGEINGVLKEPSAWSKTTIGAVPMGQEVGVTSIQLLTAMSVLANGGFLVKPHVVSEIRDQYGETIKTFGTAPGVRVLSESTSNRMKKILEGVVEEGTGKMGKVPGYTSAGKTGTAQKLEPGGSYSHDKFMASFVGFAPAEDPVIAVAVTLDEPHPQYYGGVVSAPAFSAVAADVLRYLKVGQNAPVEVLIPDDGKPAD
jgi:cell division protein FtsI (penicillin-binding protein 3)